MALNLPQLLADVENISALDDLPNDNDGLSAAELKAKFDKAGVDIKDYLNITLLPALETAIMNAASGITTPGSISGDSIAENSITSDRLAKGSVAAVTSDTIRQYAVELRHLSQSLQNTLAQNASDITANMQAINSYKSSNDEALSRLRSDMNTADLALNTNKQDRCITHTVSLASGTNTWTDVSCADVTPTNTVLISPAPASWEQYSNNGIHCTGQGSGTLSFAGWSNPTETVTVNVLILP